MANATKTAPAQAESIRLLPIKGGGGGGGSDAHGEVTADLDPEFDLDSDFGDESAPLQGDAESRRAKTRTKSQTQTQTQTHTRPRAGPRPRSRSPSPAALRRRQLRKNCVSSIGVLLGFSVVLAVIFGAVISSVDYWFKPHAGGSSSGSGSGSGAGDDISKGPFMDLGYATYVGKALSVYPPSDDGGDRHNTSAPPVAIHRYLGMRYAAPPTGQRRWRAPLPPYEETALQRATTFRDICIGLGVSAHPGSGQDEDCLFVNVWGPAHVVENVTSLPVWVFVQGGGYNANSNADIDGADVVARSNGSIVFVNFNYRVGLYGFLGVPSDNSTTATTSSSSSFSSSSEPQDTANFGLLDQRALLEWVQKHIHRFGGNPRHVVVHGGSAGAGSVALQTVAYGGRNDGLFAGIVSESLFVPTLPQCTDVAYKFWRAVDAVCYSGDQEAWTVESALACLRQQTMPVLQDVVNVGHALRYNGEDRPGKAQFYWGPCIDGTLLADRPSVLFQNGQFVRVPMLYGLATDEGTLFAPDASSQDEVVDFVVNNFPGLAANDTGANVVRQYYPQVPSQPVHNSWYPTLAQVYGELAFICPTVATLDAVAAAATATHENRNQTNNQTNNSTLYAYRYFMKDPDNFVAGTGTVHMMDAAAIFGPKNVACCPPASYTTDDADGADHSEDRDGNPGLVPVMMDYYLSFVRTFNPNTYKSAHATEWGTWDNKSRLIIMSGSAQAMETVPDDLVARCRVWQDLAGVTGQ
ncbi:MAG: hypothetical protein STHCBS139747_002931 [Sporothrix thermara]